MGDHASGECRARSHNEFSATRQETAPRPTLALSSFPSACALLALGLFQTGTALARAGWPDKPARFVVPYRPGGGDGVVHTMAAEVQKRGKLAKDANIKAD